MFPRYAISPFMVQGRRKTSWAQKKRKPVHCKSGQSSEPTKFDSPTQIQSGPLTQTGPAHHDSLVRFGPYRSSRVSRCFVKSPAYPKSANFFGTLRLLSDVVACWRYWAPGFVSSLPPYPYFFASSTFFFLLSPRSTIINFFLSTLLFLFVAQRHS